MNKNEVIRKTLEFVNNHQIKSDDYYLTFGCGLVMYNIRKETNDIDITITDKSVFDRLCEEFSEFINIGKFTGKKVIKYREFDILFRFPKYKILMIDNLSVLSIEGIKKEKENLGREKDLRDISMIQKYLER